MSKLITNFEQLQIPSDCNLENMSGHTNAHVDSPIPSLDFDTPYLQFLDKSIVEKHGQGRLVLELPRTEGALYIPNTDPLAVVEDLPPKPIVSPLEKSFQLILSGVGSRRSEISLSKIRTSDEIKTESPMAQFERNILGTDQMILGKKRLTINPKFDASKGFVVFGLSKEYQGHSHVGVYTDVKERAHKLGLAMNELCQANLRVGFAVAARSPKYRKPIVDFYRAKDKRIVISNVVNGAKKHSDDHRVDARGYLLNAANIGKVLNAGLISKEMANKLDEEYKKSFAFKFSGPANMDERAKYRAIFKAQIQAPVVRQPKLFNLKKA
jgi:hypothetical protein